MLRSYSFYPDYSIDGYNGYKVYIPDERIVGMRLARPSALPRLRMSWDMLVVELEFLLTIPPPLHKTKRPKRGTWFYVMAGMSYEHSYIAIVEP